MSWEAVPRFMELKFEKAVTNPTMPMQTFFTHHFYYSLPVPATDGACKTFRRSVVASSARKRGIPTAQASRADRLPRSLAALLSLSQFSSFKFRLGALEAPGEMGHHHLAKVVRADDSRTIFDLFSHPKVVEGPLSSPSQT